MKRHGLEHLVVMGRTRWEKSKKASET